MCDATKTEPLKAAITMLSIIPHTFMKAGGLMPSQNKQESPTPTQQPNDSAIVQRPPVPTSVRRPQLQGLNSPAGAAAGGAAGKGRTLLG